MRTLPLSIMIALAITACSQTDGAVDAGDIIDVAPSLDAPRDAPSACPSTTLEPWRAEAATRSPDGEGWCCEPGLPTCDCGYFGGFVVDRCSCGVGGFASPYGDCDLAPPDWILETDSHGCRRYSARFPTTECCNCPDAG